MDINFFNSSSDFNALCFLYPISISFHQPQGIRGFFPGLGVAVVGSTPAGCLYFTSYEMCKRYFARDPALYAKHADAANFAAGLIAEAFSCLLWVPVDVAKGAYEFVFVRVWFILYHCITLLSHLLEFMPAFFSLTVVFDHLHSAQSACKPNLRSHHRFDIAVTLTRWRPSCATKVCAESIAGAFLRFSFLSAMSSDGGLRATVILLYLHACDCFLFAVIRLHT